MKRRGEIDLSEMQIFINGEFHSVGRMSGIAWSIAHVVYSWALLTQPTVACRNAICIRTVIEATNTLPDLPAVIC